MVNLKNNICDEGLYPCTGCSACSAICNQKAISIVMNNDGFFAPALNNDKCIHCGECKSVCYKYLSEDEKQLHPLINSETHVLAAVDSDAEFTKTVSSSGVAARLASYYFEQGYKVVGVEFNPNTDACFHSIAKDEETLERHKTSKYLQSDISSIYAELNGDDKYIIFGTPCQIYGIRKYIQAKNIEKNFILVDLFCKGVPSFLLWKSYKQYLEDVYNIHHFDCLTFRDKTEGWHRFSLFCKDKDNSYRQTVYTDFFYAFFIKNVCFNLSCYNCRFRHTVIYSDIRLGDFWGRKYYNSELPVSLVMLNTERGINAFKEINYKGTTEENNPTIVFESQRFNEFPVHRLREQVLDMFRNNVPLLQIMEQTGIDKEDIYRG